MGHQKEELEKILMPKTAFLKIYWPKIMLTTLYKVNENVKISRCPKFGRMWVSSVCFLIVSYAWWFDSNAAIIDV